MIVPSHTTKSIMDVAKGRLGIVTVCLSGRIGDARLNGVVRLCRSSLDCSSITVMLEILAVCRVCSSAQMMTLIEMDLGERGK